jgi:hypothetical protein
MHRHGAGRRRAPGGRSLRRGRAGARVAGRKRRRRRRRWGETHADRQIQLEHPVARAWAAAAVLAGQRRRSLLQAQAEAARGRAAQQSARARVPAGGPCRIIAPRPALLQDIGFRKRLLARRGKGCTEGTSVCWAGMAARLRRRAHQYPSACVVGGSVSCSTVPTLSARRSLRDTWAPAAHRPGHPCAAADGKEWLCLRAPSSRPGVLGLKPASAS